MPVILLVQKIPARASVGVSSPLQREPLRSPYAAQRFSNVQYHACSNQCDRHEKKLNLGVGKESKM